MSIPRLSRFTQLTLIAIAVGVWGLLLTRLLPIAHAASDAPQATHSATFDTLTVHRINVVAPDGATRLVISNAAQFPAAKIRGKSYPRSIHDTAGMLFYDPKGNEIGGLVLAKRGKGEQSSLILDYAYQPTDGISMSKFESADGDYWNAGFTISDRRPYKPGPIKSSQGIPRIALVDKNENAQLIVLDPEGHPRISIGVDKSGEPRIEMLDKNGKVIYSAPTKSNHRGH